MDGLYLSAVLRELRDTILGSRVEKVHQPDSTRLVISLSRKRRLLMSASPDAPALYLCENVPANPERPPAFCQLLRKRISGAVIEDVSQPGLERIVTITLSATSEYAEPRTLHLIIEVMGKHSNIILVDGSLTIIAAIKRVGSDVNRYRQVLPGLPYIRPPQQDKVELYPMDQEAVIERLSGLAGTPLWKALLQCIAGIGPPTAKEVARRAGLEPYVKVGTLGPGEMNRVLAVLGDLARMVREGSYKPSLLLDEAGSSPVALSACGFTVGRTFEDPSPSRVAEMYFSALSDRRQFRSLQGTLLTVVRRHLDRAKGKKQKQLESLAEAQRAEDLRLKGELILANIYRLEKGQARAVLENYYAGDEHIAVDLDPRLSPAENAQRYFDRYNKARRTLILANQQLERTEEEIRYLEEVENSLERAESLRELEEVREQLARDRYIQAKPGQPSRRPRPLGPIEYDLGEGWRALVGRNTRQNDYLTLRRARPDDIWLHVKDLPGAHVILQGPGGEPPGEVLERAASIAAYHSAARHSSNVPVDYTRARHVRKPRGARPGMVIYDHHRTINVAPLNDRR